MSFSAATNSLSCCKTFLHFGGSPAFIPTTTTPRIRPTRSTMSKCPKFCASPISPASNLRKKRRLRSLYLIRASGPSQDLGRAGVDSSFPQNNLPSLCPAQGAPPHKFLLGLFQPVDGSVKYKSIHRVRVPSCHDWPNINSAAAPFRTALGGLCCSATISKNCPPGPGVPGQQLLTKSQVFEDEVLPGTEGADHPAEEMLERRDQSKNLSRKYRIELCASFVLCLSGV